MGIDAVWRTEHGHQLESLLDPRMFLSQFAEDSLHTQTNCLRFLDRYGNACFNYLQVPVLCDELRASIDSLPMGPLQTHLETLLAFCYKAHGRHTYLWFEGD